MQTEWQKFHTIGTKRQTFNLFITFASIWSLCLIGFVQSIKNDVHEQDFLKEVMVNHPNLFPPASASNNEPINRVYFDDVWKLQSHPSIVIPVPRASYPTFGMVWPLPKLWSSTQQFYPVDYNRLSVDLRGETNFILQAAVQRFTNLLHTRTGLSFYSTEWLHQRTLLKNLARDHLSENNNNFNLTAGTAGTDPLSSTQPTIPWSEEIVNMFHKRFNADTRSNSAAKAGALRKVVLLTRSAGSSWPSLKMDESYILSVSPKGILLYANETWGALHALTSLIQLFWTVPGTSEVYVNRTYIDDAPRFPHRGVMIDTARHFISKQILLVNLETMAFNKMNVFHWHMVDDQAYPYQSDAYPNLSQKGAYSQNQVYTMMDVKEVIEFARIRGIRVVPEFDIPGHARSLAFGLPELLAQCLSGFSDNTLYFGPLNPLKNRTYEFLQGLFRELLNIFPDEFLHLGGDEVETGCWSSDPFISRMILRHNVSEVHDIHEYFWRNVQNLVTNLGIADPKKRRQLVVWEDVLEHVTELQESLLVHVWKSDLTAAIQQGYRVIYSTCWYLDRLWDVRKWPNYYLCDPVTSSPSMPILPAQHDRILGGEACMWTEYQSDDTILQKIWPVTSAIAERLWSPAFVNNMDTVGPRIEEQRCRMVERGVPVGVLLGPGACQSAGVFSTFVKPEGSSHLNSEHNDDSVDSLESAQFDDNLHAAQKSNAWCFALYFFAGVLLGIVSVFFVSSRISTGALGVFNVSRLKFLSTRTVIPILFLVFIVFLGLSRLCS